MVRQIERAVNVGPRRYEAEMELGSSYSQAALMTKLVRLVEGSEDASAKEVRKAEKGAYA